MQRYTKAGVEVLPHDQLMNALTTCAVLYGRESQGYAADNPGVAGENTCLLEEEVRRRLRQIPDIKAA